ncbi:MAG TPA: hypothetical protein VF875_04720 [Anaeromyxobacter sp.]
MTPALLLLALAAAPGPTSAADVERRRTEVAREILSLGPELRREVVAEDAHALAVRVPPDGLRCAGRTVPRARVERDLRTPGAWLHDALFGGAAPARAGAPRSLAELLRGSSDVAMAVSFAKDPRAGDVGRPCLEFRAKDLAASAAPLCFERRDGRWWLAESLYPCG